MPYPFYKFDLDKGVNAGDEGDLFNKKTVRSLAIPQSPIADGGMAPHRDWK